MSMLLCGEEETGGFGSAALGVGRLLKVVLESTFLQLSICTYLVLWWYWEGFCNLAGSIPFALESTLQ